jgi:glycosyltransferase involved in cell wall biosynthesis
MRDLCAGRYEFEVITTRASNLEVLRSLGVPAGRFAFTIADKLLSYLAASPWWQGLQVRLRFTAPFEKALVRRGCDLVYFATPSTRPSILQRLNYVATLLDLCHRDAPEFPEVREYARFQVRERLYRSVLPPAWLILTDSAELASTAAHRYGIDAERLLPMPFAPAPLLAAEASRDTVLGKYRLEDGYYFYPAQFWAHKNHVRILQALVLLRDDGLKLRVAFAGGDPGNRAHVERFIETNALREQVRLLGFVPQEDMRALYEGCRAVVMPTYFGPTNIPPLEAWLLRRPLIYSSALKAQAGDAALCVDADDARALANAMRACTDATTCARLVEAGTLRLQEIEEQRKAAEEALLARLRRFEARRACWP